MNNHLSIRHGGNGGGNYGNGGNGGNGGSGNGNGNGVGEDVIDVGTPRHPAGWSTTLVRYHDFARLPRRRGLDHVDSPPFRSHGLDWYLRVHPGGAASASGDDCVSLYLRCKTASDQNVPVMAEFSLALRGGDGRVESAMSCPRNAFRRKRKGWPNFASRSRLLDPTSGILDDDGTLAVVVGIQLFREREAADFVPRNAVAGLSRLLSEANSPPAPDDCCCNECHVGGGHDDCGGGDGGGCYLEVSPTRDTADVIFSVGEGGGETFFRAHRLILQLAAPALAQLCEDADERAPVPIAGVRPRVFRWVLRYAYGDDVPDGAWTATTAMTATTTTTTTTTTSTVAAMGDGGGGDGAADRDGPPPGGPAIELLDAANQFGVVGLKILAETKIIGAGITASNFSDLILYADARDCALLRERCVDYYVLNAREVRRHPSYARVRESAAILDELMEALLGRLIRRSRSSGDDDVDYETMGVNLLRRTLDGRGLDVDGSREMLVRRLRRWDGRRSVTVQTTAKTAVGSEG